MKYLYKQVPIRDEAITIFKQHLAPVHGDMDVQFAVEVNCAYREMQSHDTAFATMRIDHPVLRHLGTDHYAIALPDGHKHTHYRVCDLRDKSAAVHAEALIRSFNARYEGSKPAIDVIAGDLAKIDEAILAHLPDLEVRVDGFSQGRFTITARWTGLSAANRPARRYDTLIKYGTVTPGHVTKAIVRLAKAQAKERRKAGDSLTMDPVLHATLTRLGIDVTGFVEDVIARHTRQLAEPGTPGDGPIDAAGMRFFWKIHQGHIGAKYELGEGITWSGNAVVLRGMQFPDTVISAIGGKPVESLIRHPDLTGYDIASVVQSDGPKGSTTTTMMTRATTDPVVLTMVRQDLPLAA